MKVDIVKYSNTQTLHYHTFNSLFSNLHFTYLMALENTDISALRNPKVNIHGSLCVYRIDLITCDTHSVNKI